MLTSESSSKDDDPTTDTGSADGQIEITADNTEISLSVDDSDKIEITGKCTDLDRRKNRILVEVFAGEDESATPYISNGISDFCQTVAAGIAVGSTPQDACFWVTKGVGIIEPPPVSRSFPQCHDGVFGFAVKLGKVLENGVLPPLKYTIRFKMRTLDGILADTPWSRVSVTRTLNTPSIDRISANDSDFSCLVETSPARFNQDITYMLTKTATGNGASVIFGDVYPGRLTTATITPEASVFSWKNWGAGAGMIAGATYTYTLDSLHANPYFPSPYITPPTATSNALTCTLARPQIYMTIAPTNYAPNNATCYFGTAGLRINPQLGAGVEMEWGYNTQSGWTGSDGNFTGSLPVPTCAGLTLTNCTATNLVPGVQYYFAMREKYAGPPALAGKWSPEVQCIPPGP